MFWESVVAGLKTLTYWETYAAAVEYLAIYTIPMFIVIRIAEKKRQGGRVMQYISLLLLPLMQVAALVVFILTMATIIFGFTGDAAWSFPWKIMVKAPMAFFIIVGALIVLSFILSLIPLIGRMHSLQTLVLGGAALIFVLSTFDSVSAGHARVNVDFIPGIWFLLGLIVIGGFMSWIGTFLSEQLVSMIRPVNERVVRYIMIPVSATFGFIPLFMYGAWLGAQVKGGF
jgi:hypothetical protein